MGHPQTPSNSSSSSPHLYPQALQLKLYQAFIFSVPVLFSVILFLLFYLFYLKRRRNNSSNLSSSSLSTSIPIRSISTSNSLLPLALEVDLKEEFKEKLQIILFDEDLRAKDSQCCVCLGEFEMKEQLHQISVCKHVFHMECIHHWLQANTTCPLCRCSIIPTRKRNPDSASTPLSLFPRSDLNSLENLQLENSEDAVISVVVNIVSMTLDR